MVFMNVLHTKRLLCMLLDVFLFLFGVCEGFDWIAIRSQIYDAVSEYATMQALLGDFYGFPRLFCYKRTVFICK